MVCFFLKRPRLLCGGWTVGGRSEAGRLVSGESKEAYVSQGSRVLAANSEDGRRDRAPQRLQDILAAERGGHRLPLEPVRSVLTLPLELRLPG